MFEKFYSKPTSEDQEALENDADLLNRVHEQVGDMPKPTGDVIDPNLEENLHPVLSIEEVVEERNKVSNPDNYKELT